ncbi:TetR/AcrR family transcriptional regulator [Arsenicicoccus dermatophilus]|nr:TetR/AcrR family transcriptional regulator [Arsenicicoccus dermatophilus]
MTHRAVDAEARVPAGTCANYFRSRSDLLAGMAQRIFALLAPDPARLDELSRLPTDDAGPAYAGYVVERLLARPNLARALVELRLEATRSPDVAHPLTELLRAGFDADVDFHTTRGLPGGREHVLRLHHLVDGIVLDALTIPLAPDIDPVTQARNATRTLDR